MDNVNRGPDEKIDIIPEQCQITTKSQEEFSNANCNSNTVRQGKNIDTMQSRWQRIVEPNAEFLNSIHKLVESLIISTELLTIIITTKNEIVYQIALKETVI